jgi:hypothetical protein
VANLVYQAAGADAAFFMCLVDGFFIDFFMAPEAAMLELVAIGAEALMAGAGVAAIAPMLKAEAMTAAMRVFMELSLGVGRADCSASQRHSMRLG